MSGWSRFPTWWVRKKMLPLFSVRAATAGVHQTALRLYLSIALLSDYHTWQAQISFAEFEQLANVSRPMISRGLLLLEELGLIRVRRGSYRNQYELVVPQEDTQWAKIPTDKVRAKLSELPVRGHSALAALKLYIVLLSFRSSATRSATISYKKLEEYTGIRPGLVRPGLDHLINHQLIHVDRHAEWSSKAGHPVHQYILLGNFEGQQRKVVIVRDKDLPF